MTTLPSLGGTRSPDFGYAKAPKRAGKLWKWSLAVTAAVFVFYAWQCGSALVSGPALADAAVRQFHEQLNQGRYPEIMASTDRNLRDEAGHESTATLFSEIHTKLGDAGEANMAHMNAQVGTRGTIIVCQYDTTFARGSAVETFTWKMAGGALQLIDYNIESNAVLLRPE